jgi:hypothetical protein
MSTTTLTIIPDEDSPAKTMDFAFTRNMHGEGGWVTKGGMPGLPTNCFVHTEMQQSLTTIALERGLTEAHNFAMNRPKPKPPVRVARVKGEKKAKATKVGSGMVGGFNPFA